MGLSYSQSTPKWGVSAPLKMSLPFSYQPLKTGSHIIGTTRCYEDKVIYRLYYSLLKFWMSY